MARSKWKPFLKPLAGLAVAGAVVAALWWIAPALGLMAALMVGALVYAGIAGWDVRVRPMCHCCRFDDPEGDPGSLDLANPWRRLNDD